MGAECDRKIALEKAQNQKKEYRQRVLISAPEVALPSRTALDRAKIELERALGLSKVNTTEEGCLSYAMDESEARGRAPEAIVLAENRDDILATLRIAEECGVPVTPRAGGTGRTGGAVPVAGGIVLATHRLSQVLELNRNDMLCVVQPGVITGELHATCEKEGLFYPPDPNSLKTCMIGGNVAENAGGPRAFKYGVTREYVLGLEACLMGGHAIQSGRRTVKGVTGYDTTSLFVGSEGTLGVFSQVTLRLVPKPTEIATVLALYSDVASCADAVRAMIAGGLEPRCIELMDAPTLVAIRAQGVAIDTRAHAMILVEFDGTHASVEEQLAKGGEILSAGQEVIDVMAAQDASQRARLWEARRMLSPATRKLAKYKISEDVVVPRSQLTRFLQRVSDIGAREKVHHLTYGHAGDGNLHVNVLWNDDEERPRIDRALLEIMKATVELGGTLSGEHGIGVTKAAYLPLEQPTELITLQQNLKKVFDPKGLLNPGKIFPNGHSAC